MTVANPAPSIPIPKWNISIGSMTRLIRLPAMMMIVALFVSPLTAQNGREVIVHHRKNYESKNWCKICEYQICIAVKIYSKTDAFDYGNSIRGMIIETAKIRIIPC